MTDTNDRREEVAASRGDRVRSLVALHRVERHAGAAGPSRPDEWRDDLLMALDDLVSSLHHQYARSSGEDGLLYRVAMEAPHLETAVDELRQSQARLIDEIDDLRQSLADLTRPFDVAAVRSRIGDMTTEIRELRAWETDIVYDAYAFDLGTSD